MAQDSIKHFDLSKDTLFYYKNSVIMKGRPQDVFDDYLLVLNKLNKTQAFKLGFTNVGYAMKLRYELGNHSCDSNGCNLPQFVHQMNATLFAKIDGVVDFNFKSESGGKSGYFLLLNIEGKPMGCFTFEDEDISEEVRHKVLLFY